MTGSRELVAAVRTAKQFLTYVASGPFRYAVAEALPLPDTHYEAFRTGLQAKRDLLKPTSPSTSPRARTSSPPASLNSPRATTR
ncbi:hypothetical protein [Streptomyces sp. IBSBF 2435]|uniref:hypothetical protein n=1 Tax=Streptomyces sp. IBSBF 2435 TaxID=2903531 RepID=UPI003FA7F045